MAVGLLDTVDVWLEALVSEGTRLRQAGLSSVGIAWTRAQPQHARGIMPLRHTPAKRDRRSRTRLIDAG
jgi:hypothetical protein